MWNNNNNKFPEYQNGHHYRGNEGARKGSPGIFGKYVAKVKRDGKQGLKGNRNERRHLEVSMRWREDERK